MIKQKATTIDDVVLAVAEDFNINADDLKNPANKGYKYAPARKVGAYIASRMNADLSNKTIAKGIGISSGKQASAYFTKVQSVFLKNSGITEDDIALINTIERIAKNARIKLHDSPSNG